MKKIAISALLTLVSISGAWAQKSDVLGVGARVGMASFMQKTNDWKWKLGMNTLLDVDYVHYFGTIDQKGSQVGIRTGLSLGYTQNALAAPIELQHRTQDNLNNNILYTITSDRVKEMDRQILLEIPVMAEFTFWHMYADLGLKVGIPVWSRYKQVIDDISIDAYYEDFDVHVTDEVLTGVLSEEGRTTTNKWNGANVNLSVMAEIGYLFELKNGNSIGVGLYADYTFWNNYKNESPSLLVDVDTRTIDPMTSTPATVHITNLTNAYVDKLGYFDFGVKVSYNFNLKKQKSNLDEEQDNH